MFEKRVKRVMAQMKTDDLDALLVVSTSNIFYLTGEVFSDQSHEAYLLITQNDVYLFTDKRYLGAIKKDVYFSPVEISRDCPVAHACKDIVRHKKFGRVGFEKKYFTFSEYELFATSLKKYCSFVAIHDIIGTVRSLKDTEEIKMIEQAASLTDAAMSIAVKLLREGVSEYEIAYGVESFIKMHGATLAFPSIVAFGNNSAIPHHRTSGKKLSKQDRVVLIDMGARLDMYCADMTRVFYTTEASKDLDHVFSTVLHANRAAIELFDSNPFQGKLTLGDLGTVSSAIVSNADLPTIPHALGHGVGIDIHELPVVHEKATDVVADGMVFSIEPGVYIEGKYGVRIEDLVAIVNGAMKVLSRFPKEHLVIENM